MNSSSQGVEPVSPSRHPLCRLNAGAEPRNSRIDRNLEPLDDFVSFVLLSFATSLFNVDFNGFSGIRLGFFFFHPLVGARADIGGLLLIFLTGKRETTILSVNEQPRRNFRSGRHCSLLLSRFLLLGILGCIGESRQFLC